MEIKIVDRNPKFCELYTHPFPEKAGLDFYCRIAQQKLSKEYLFCPDCPLMIFDAERERYFGCLYYDTEGSAAESDAVRIRIAIENGLVPEFPYYAEHREAERVEHALQFAAEAHKGKLRKGSGIPYIVHPAEVVGICSRMTKDLVTLQAAALHDVVEDTPITMEELIIEFGSDVADRVADMTEDKRRDIPAAESWEDRKKASLAHYKTISTESKKIALADKLSNIRATAVDFRKNKDTVWEKFNQKDKSKQEWYYRSLLDSLEELKDTEAYQEYEALVNEVFFE